MRLLHSKKGLTKSIKANPGTPMYGLAKKHLLHCSTISRDVKSMGSYSYKWIKAHYLTSAVKDIGRKILKSLKSMSTPSLKFFSDDKCD
uniref:Uncharacterized protein n=1 Tax=Lepeophtheirus salmonis TaxID=72036 RepID=A0A0K2TEH5_LEPSM